MHVRPHIVPAASRSLRRGVAPPPAFEQANARERADFDAIVIGSGVGGSVVTDRLAEAGMRVCLLERGRAYPPGLREGASAKAPLE